MAIASDDKLYIGKEQIYPYNHGTYKAGDTIKTIEKNNIKLTQGFDLFKLINTAYQSDITMNVVVRYQNAQYLDKVELRAFIINLLSIYSNHNDDTFGGTVYSVAKIFGWGQGGYNSTKDEIFISSYYQYHDVYLSFEQP